MPYSNLYSVKLRLPSFFRSDQDTLVLADYTSNITEADIEAQSIIDSFLAVKYVVPFSVYGSTNPPCPKIITTISGLLCRSQFLLDQYLGDGLNAEPKMSKVLYERAMLLLEKLLEDKITIAEASIVPSVNLGIYSSTFRKKSILYHFDLTNKVYPCITMQLGAPNKVFRTTP